MAKDQLPIDSGEAFIAQLEQAVMDGDADFIDKNIPSLRQLIARYQDRIFELAKLQQRAREVLEQHEPSAAKRKERQ
jgi:hypothetical protein